MHTQAAMCIPSLLLSGSCKAFLERKILKKLKGPFIPRSSTLRTELERGVTDEAIPSKPKRVTGSWCFSVSWCTADFSNSSTKRCTYREDKYVTVRKGGNWTIQTKTTNSSVTHIVSTDNIDLPVFFPIISWLSDSDKDERLGSFGNGSSYSNFCAWCLVQSPLLYSSWTCWKVVYILNVCSAFNYQDKPFFSTTCSRVNSYIPWENAVLVIICDCKYPPVHIIQSISQHGPDALYVYNYVQQTSYCMFLKV